MPQRNHRPPRLATCAALAAVAVGMLAALPAAAETSPYYVGIAQTFTHESNLLRVRDNQVAPPGLTKSDTISSTAVVAGIDQRFSRQRVNGSATVRSNRYGSNEQFNGQSYNATLALDWETLETLRGNVNVGADRAQRSDIRGRNGQFITDGNTETRNRFGATASLGIAGPLGLEVGLNGLRVRYSSSLADYANYTETSGFGGLRYRLGGATSVSLGLRQTRTDYPNLLIATLDPRDKRTRNDVDIGMVWVPSGTSRLDLRLSQGKTKHDQLPQRDFSGSSGAVTWSWTPGGRLRLNARAARDIGQSSQFFTTASAFSQTLDSLRVSADYDLTGKITLTSALQTYRRNLDRTGQLATPVTGSDTTSTVTLGARWTPLRSVSVGCQASAEKRGSNSNILLNEPYSANSVACFGQLTLQ